MKIYGVTGTNGKTTTSILLGTILREAYGRDKVGLITTITFWLGGEEQVNETKMTTMRSRDVFKLLQQMKDRGVERVVLEVTSHALDQHRLAGIMLDGAIILNIAREHLDYHGTMDEYTRAKVKISDYLVVGAPLVVNAKIQMPNKCQTNAKIQIIKLATEQAKNVVTSLPGEVNKENVLAVILLARAVGVDEAIIKQGVAKVDHVQGRMEWVEINDQSSITKAQMTRWRLPRVLIDYAVTPDALEQLYQEVRTMTRGKIFAVLGACGQRDRGKRPMMARVVAQYADELILTREDPWEEEEEQIFRDLEKGLEPDAGVSAAYDGTAPDRRELSHAVWQRIVDRRKAIKFCIDKAGLDDVVVVTGKGAETGMAIGKKILPWSDKQVIQELLAEKARKGAL